MCLKMNMNKSKLYKRSLFLEERGKALVVPHIERRQHMPRTAAATVREIQERATPSTPMPEGKTGRGRGARCASRLMD
ncbi:hypothetical protein AAFF_G00007500 [Aldrovandia affinis]|uniref:Uncharacterized protein n=1 Tax=Aldrovandia affinis TaxID=143900 RepID=A0AAD7T619_9TELE|nr:hypothetical protein AAFF_G00007500 [Aldrovandia affinis]